MLDVGNQSTRFTHTKKKEEKKVQEWKHTRNDINRTTTTNRKCIFAFSAISDRHERVIPKAHTLMA